VTERAGASGIMADMRAQKQRVGIRDVARHAGVSLSSVSRVLDDHADVSEAMRRRVLDSVGALGYTPDPLARSMRKGRTMTVGFVAGDTSNPLISQIAAAAQRRLRESGYSLLVANSGNDSHEEATNIRLLHHRKVDGMLLSIADETSDELHAALDELAIPVVLVDREQEGAELSTVRSDHALGMSQAVGHLRDLGHSRIALINGNPRVRPSRERAQALRAASSEDSTLVVSGTFSESHGYDSTMALLQRRDRPTTIIAGSNQILVGVLRALRDLRLEIPDDISLVTCDATPLAELNRPEIATILRDPPQMGREAADLLVRNMTGEAPASRVLPTRFVAGASCARVEEEET